MSTLGWVSVVLEKVEKFTNSYLQSLFQAIKSLVVNEKQTPKQFHALETQIM